MFNKYLLVAVGVLLGGCVLFYHLWDSTKLELNEVKAQKITLEQELKRRDENEKNLSKRISELTLLYASNNDWANNPVADDIVNFLRKSCKACK